MAQESWAVGGTPRDERFVVLRRWCGVCGGRIVETIRVEHPETWHVFVVGLMLGFFVGFIVSKVFL